MVDKGERKQKDNDVANDVDGTEPFVVDLDVAARAVDFALPVVVLGVGATDDQAGDEAADVVEDDEAADGADGENHAPDGDDGLIHGEDGEFAGKNTHVP